MKRQLVKARKTPVGKIVADTDKVGKTFYPNLRKAAIAGNLLPVPGPGTATTAAYVAAAAGTKGMLELETKYPRVHNIVKGLIESLPK